MKFKKKPVIIEAHKWTGDAEALLEAFPEGHDIFIFHNKVTLVIPTLEGLHTANVGDWVIKGVQGEFYPCKPDIFEQTYEPIEEKENEE